MKPYEILHPRIKMQFVWLVYYQWHEIFQFASYRLFTTVRDSLGLTYDVSFELNLFDRLKLGWYVVSVTSTPGKVGVQFSRHLYLKHMSFLTVNQIWIYITCRFIKQWRHARMSSEVCIVTGLFPGSWTGWIFTHLSYAALYNLVNESSPIIVQVFDVENVFWGNRLNQISNYR